jgi:hypothetical protein
MGKWNGAWDSGVMHRVVERCEGLPGNVVVRGVMD